MSLMKVDYCIQYLIFVKNSVQELQFEYDVYQKFVSVSG